MSIDKGLGSVLWIRKKSSPPESSLPWLPFLDSSSRSARAGTLFSGMQKAEAGMFSGLTDAFKHDATKAVKDTVKEQVNKALQINFDGMDSHRNDMIHHLRLACGWFGSSEYKIMGATQSASQSDMQAYGVLVNNLLNNSSSRSMDEVYTLASTPRPSKEQVQAGLQQLMGSGDKQAQEDAKQKMSWAKGDNARALLFCGLAARDAAFLTSETANGLKDAKNLEDIKARLNGYSAAIKDAKSVISMIQSSIKDRNNARKAYDKANNIKEPNKKDIKASVNALDAE